MTMTELFGSSSVTAVVEMPSCIDTLATRLPKEKRIKALDLIMNHTLFPYYAVFLDEKKITAVINAMMGNGGGSICTMTGIMASSVSTSECLRFCPVCAKDDKARYGEYYWHRLHQVPGVILCPVHSAIIMDSNVNLDRQNKHEFIAANEQDCSDRLVTIKYSDAEIKRLLKLSSDIEWTIRNYHAIRGVLNSDNKIRDSYISMLKQKGYATINGRVYQYEFISDFIKFYGCSFLKTVQSEFEYENESNWLSEIVRKHRKSFHSVRHLLLMGFLSGSTEQFFSSTDKYQPFGKGPWPCLNPTCVNYRKLVVKQITITHCSDTKLPVGTFECTCGFKYSRRGPDVSKNDIYKIGRIKKFGYMWEQKLRILVEENRFGLRETSRLLNADPKTIKAYSQKLGLETCWDEKSSESIISIKVNYASNVVAENDRMLNEHRTGWVSAVKNNLGKSKTELRDLAKAHYSWLYRHDKNWLDENSPKAKYAPVNNHRVDWEQRDMEILPKVMMTVKDMFATEGKPVRISLSRIGKITGLLGLLEKHLEKLPQTKIYIESVVESDCDYRKRRIKWAVQELSNSGEEPKVWRAMRKAGIREEYKKEIVDYIFHQLVINARLL